MLSLSEEDVYNMTSKAIFKVEINWQEKPKEELEANRRIAKNHVVCMEGKPDLPVSAAKIFKGDPNLYNPEELLLSSLASCHMMSYLYCCAQEKIEVIAYTDSAEALLETSEDGSGRVSQVTLHPIVTIANEKQMQQALELHIKANELCFIANSCNFPVLHEAKCQVL